MHPTEVTGDEDAMSGPAVHLERLTLACVGRADGQFTTIRRVVLSADRSASRIPAKVVGAGKYRGLQAMEQRSFTAYHYELEAIWSVDGAPALSSSLNFSSTWTSTIPSCDRRFVVP